MAQRNFKGIWIPAEIWLSKELTLTEKVFLVEISSLDNEKGCFANNEYFAQFFGMSKKQAQRIITSLIDKGFLKSSIDKEAGNKRILSSPIPKNGDTPIPKNEDSYSQKWDAPIPKNEDTPIPKNGMHNNTVINSSFSSSLSVPIEKNSAHAQNKNFNISSNSQNTTPASVATPFFTPAKDDVVKYFTEAGASKQSGERFFNQFEAVNWTSKGEKITKWQNLADSWVKNEPNMKKTTTSNTKNLQRKTYQDYD